ncbi:protein shortage in chiasmata 1 ortholog [Anolis carolinensis]|uniref:protein shortage in chiasmata 1 ortholog n=1 Tax=Anolis carolinensis TaxID=28377 RepID=UPI002F2B6CBA
MFAALKYIGVDYFYEKVTRERLSFQCLAIHLPSCLYQDKNYYHDGDFADDKYRRPWTRVSIDSTQMTFTVLDLWKKCLYIEDFLEKKPISSTCFHIHNEDVEIVPSSNPCSQCDIEEAYVLTKDGEKQEFTSASDLQSSSSPVLVKEQGKGLYIEDELVFTDCLRQYSKWLPTLQTLLSRLNVLFVEDPLLNPKGDPITEEDIFRECFTFKRSVTLLVREEPRENFCKVSIKDEETLVLPIRLPFYKVADFRLQNEIPTYLMLKSLFQVTPEVTRDENEGFKIATDDFRTKITPEKMGMSDCCSTQDISANKNNSMLQFSEPASYCSFHPTELEVPLTPPKRTKKLHVSLLCTQLQTEPVSPFGKSDLISKSTVENVENLMWQSERYQHPMNSLLLADHQNVVPLCEHLPVNELKTLLFVHKDISIFSSLEEDGWINLWEKMALPSILEAFSTDLSDGKELVCTHGDAFTKITRSQLDKCLEENISFSKTTVESFGVQESSGKKDSYWFPPKKEMFSRFHLEPASAQCSTALADDRSPTENHIRETKLEREIGKHLSFGIQEERKNEEYQDTTPQKKSHIPLELPRKSQEDFDFLSNFIMLRSKHVITQSEKTNDMDIQEEGPHAEESSASGAHDSPIASKTMNLTEKQTKENEAIASIEIKPSESQLQSYLVLEAAVAPVLQDLVTLGRHNWKFATLNFDDSRFFLKQQEKVMSDTFKEGMTGTQDGKDITLFKHAAVLHLLVTVRDLLLTCNLSTALGYLSKAKDNYKDFLGSSLDNIWRQLKIVQFALQKHETNPKITELQHQISKSVHGNTDDQNKVVIVTRMDFDEEIADLINIISTVQGLKIGCLHAEKRGTLLESKNVISSLQRYSCVVVRNQHIGPDFPWTHFSLVVEYNYSKNSCWIDLCKNLDLSYITFKIALPEAAGIDKAFPDHSWHILLNVPIPYVFLTSEGLLNTPEILQLLESQYNITFIERSCCEALQFFGSTERYVVMTIDECTALVMQNVEELNYEKSSDNIVLRLMVLSLQYNSCWIILYSRERLSSHYSLGGKTLHHLALIYAALVPFAQKSEDFDVKVALTPGIEETAFLVRQIADHTLLTSKRHPQEWLDKAWLSVLPSEAEKCLLTFPCINPLVAQVMLKKSSSLEWLLSASFAQLQQLLPEVPEKTLKHFSDITSLYTMKSLPKSKPVKEPMPHEGETDYAISSYYQLLNSEALLSNFQESNPFNEYSDCSPVQKSGSTYPGYHQNELCKSPKSTRKQNVMAPSISYKKDMGPFQNTVEKQQYLLFLKRMEAERRILNNPGEPNHISFEASMPYLDYSQNGPKVYLENVSQKIMFPSKGTGGQKPEMPVLLKNPVHQDVKKICEIQRQPLVKQCHSAQDFRDLWYVDCNKDSQLKHSPGHFLREFERTECYNQKPLSEERFRDERPFLQTAKSSFHSADFYKPISNRDGFFDLNFQMTGKCAGRKGPNLSSNQREQGSSAGLEFAQLPQLKKRRLTFEKDPKRSDGQTRLKFF